MKIFFASNKISKIVIIGLILSLSIVLLKNPRFQEINASHPGYKYDIRLTMWDTAIKVSLRNVNSFLFGYGLQKGYEEYNNALKKVDHYYEYMKLKFNSSHNDYLDILIMFGFFGLLSFLLMIFSLLSYAIKCKNYLLIAFILMTLTQFFFGSYYFWFRTGKFSLFFLISILIPLNNSFNHKKMMIIDDEA